MEIDETFESVTSSFAINLSKQNASDLPSEINFDAAKFKLPSFCDLTNENDYNSCNKQIITSKVEN